MSDWRETTKPQADDGTARPSSPDDAPTAGRTAGWMTKADEVFRETGSIHGARCPRISATMHPTGDTAFRRCGRLFRPSAAARCRVRFKDVWARWFEAPTATDMKNWREHGIRVETPHGKAMRLRMKGFETVAEVADSLRAPV